MNNTCQFEAQKKDGYSKLTASENLIFKKYDMIPVKAYNRCNTLDRL